MNRLTTQLTLALLVAVGLAHVSSAAGGEIGQYDVVWESPSADQSGLMPLGNGDIAAGVCAIENDALYLLLSKSDAFSYNGDIFKTGRVKISLEPNPFASGKPFRQTMDLETGSILIEADDIHLRIWADANRPIYHVQIKSENKIAVRAEPDLWQRMDSCGKNRTASPIHAPTQDVRLDRKNSILWYYSVGDRSVYPTELKFYDVPEMVSEYPDPYRFNTFGNLLEGSNLALKEGVLSGDGKTFDIRIHALAKQTPGVFNWIETIERQATRSASGEQDWQEHCRWWSDFWNRSWITVSDNTLPAQQRGHLSHEGYTAIRDAKDGGALVAQSYNVFRYLMACQSRGKIQTKFNGGLFTQPLRYKTKPNIAAEKHKDGMWFSHEDDRLWGRRFTFQNQRLLYWPLLMSGDDEFMEPFFNYYWKMLPVRKAITQAWFGHEGAYYRENMEPTGGERDNGKSGTDAEDKPPRTPPGGNEGTGYYHSYYFTCGLETVAMMIEYVKYSGDQEFQDDVLVPFAREILLFFDKHYRRDSDGKLRLDPAMVLETWWIAVNPAPDVAGLQHCLDELLAMSVGSSEDQAEWQRFRAEIPELHLHQIKGRTAIAPAKSWAIMKNSENGLLYPVFPFRRFGLGMGTEDIVDWTMQHRTNKNRFECKCWTQDQIHWAYAGNAAEARDGLIRRFRHSSTSCRFPVFGTESPDSCPDFDHFGSGSVALQRMLAQEVGEKILLLPAWPANWDADFKLHLAGNTVVTGEVVDGSLKSWSIVPESRRDDVTVYEPQD